MDADRVRSYLQVACAGLGFDIGEVWWMSNDSGTSTVAAIEDNRSDSTDANSTTNNNNTNNKPRKRFLQLYTSKAYCNQRSKLVQPHDTDDKDENDEDSKPSSSTQLTVRQSNPSDEAEHVLSPRIVEAVTHTTQVVWANANSSTTSLSSTNNNGEENNNNNNNNGLLGRSDIKLQTAIGMPVGVDQAGNVWVVVMFSPNNVQSTTDAIDYLQYISKSAGSSSIPCLLPVVGNPQHMGGSNEDRKMICDGKSEDNNNNGKSEQEEDNSNSNNQQLSLVSIKPKSNIPTSHTQNLGDGVTAKFVSFNINDDDEFDGPSAGEEGKVSQLSGGVNIENGIRNSDGRRPSEVDPSSLRNAMKDDWGIPILPDADSTSNQQQQQQSQLDAIDSAITDAFDEASYGVWSTIMNSPANNNGSGGSSEKQQQQQITTTSTNESISNESQMATTNESQIMEHTKKMNVIQERLEEFATAFLGMSVFDVADAWVVSSSPTNENGASSNNNEGSKMGKELKCLFTVAATNTNPNINTLRHVSSSTTINIGDGAVGKAYSSGYPVWSSVKELIYDTHRQVTLNDCKIETAFAIPIFSSTGDANVVNNTPSCILSCYSLLPAESVPFVINFVQKAVRLLWSGLDSENITPHESVGKELWTNVNPSDLGEMAADVEMQKEFIGKKRPRGLSFQDAEREKNEQAGPAEIGQILPSLAPSPLPIEQSMDLPTIDAPPPVPGKGLAPAPLFPNTVQDRSPNAQEFVLLLSGSGNVANGGHWAVQQAVQSVAQLWDNANNAMMGSTTGGNNNINQQLPPPQYQQEQLQQSQSQQYEMAYVNYDTTNSATVAAQLVQEQITDPMSQQQHQATHQNPISMPPPQTTAAYPPHGVHADDPATIQANLLEFNAMAAMAQMNNTNNNINQHVGAPLFAAPQMAAAANQSMNGAVQMNQQLPMAVGTNHNMNVDEMISAMIAESEGPSVVTGLQQCYPATAPSTQQAHSKSTTGSKPCRIEGCTDTSLPRRPYCAKHCGTRLCEKEGCTKCAQGATRFCISHGGGRRCTFPGCDKGARDKYFCAAHGGGKRCKNPGCNKSAVGGSNFCTGHGGGRRCQVPGCDKSAQSSTKFCVKHGGGKKCQHPGCTKVSRGRTLYCAAHGGGVRCKLEGCSRVAIGKAQLCRAHGGGATRFNANGAAI